MPTPSASDIAGITGQAPQHTVTAVKKRAPILEKVATRGGGTVKAKEQAFASQVASFGKGLGHNGLTIMSQESWYPFDTKYLSDLYGEYDGEARGYIHEARKYIGRGVVFSGNEGTAPELCLLGLHLSTHQFFFGRNLWHQQSKLYGLRARGKAFTFDVAAEYSGFKWLYPVDGEQFHMANYAQELDSVIRDWRGEAVGHVFPVTDVQCYTGSGLRSLLRAAGAPF